MAYISKTDYLLWRACPKNAWLRLHRPELYKSVEITEFEQSIIDTGTEVEEIARRLFPDATLVTGLVEEAQQNTRRFLSSKLPALFQPVFDNEQLFARVDVLQCTGSSEHWIYEIKSSTEVKEEHVYDLAFQVILLRRCGLDIKRTFIIRLNPNYIREGDLDVRQVFVTEDMTDRIDQMSDDVIEEMGKSRIYLLRDAEPEGPCSCICKGRSKHCSTFDYSNPSIPKYGIHDIARIGSSPKKLKELVDAGIFELENLPEAFKLSDFQSAQLRTYRTGETIIDKMAISKKLNELSFPLHFIDYETFAPPLPCFSQYSPYNQIPLQYSLDIVGSPGEEPMHLDFLHSGTDDPSSSFVTSLKRHVAPFGSIVVWNKAFECHVNEEIARRLPDASEYLFEFNDRVYDLMEIFTNRYFVHKKLYGKVSIKKVLPLLAPQLSYSALAIQDGATASVAWMKLISGKVINEERLDFLGQLQEYCALDSYGMYAIWQALMRLITN